MYNPTALKPDASSAVPPTGFHEYVYGAVPLKEKDSATPVLSPKQISFTVVKANTKGGAIAAAATEAVDVHPSFPVTVTV